MPNKRQSKREAAPETPAKYRAMVGLSNDRTGRSYAPGEFLTSEDFDPEVLAHWEEIGRVVRVDG